MQFFKLDHNWEFVVVGSDGVWDAMSSSEMAKYIKVLIVKYLLILKYIYAKKRKQLCRIIIGIVSHLLSGKTSPLPLCPW